MKAAFFQKAMGILEEQLALLEAQSAEAMLDGNSILNLKNLVETWLKLKASSQEKTKRGGKPLGSNISNETILKYARGLEEEV